MRELLPRDELPSLSESLPQLAVALARRISLLPLLAASTPLRFVRGLMRNQSSLLLLRQETLSVSLKVRGGGMVVVVVAYS